MRPARPSNLAGWASLACDVFLPLCSNSRQNLRVPGSLRSFWTTKTRQLNVTNEDDDTAGVSYIQEFDWVGTGALNGMYDEAAQGPSSYGFENTDLFARLSPSAGGSKVPRGARGDGAQLAHAETLF